jgi:hypothetical protein
VALVVPGLDDHDYPPVGVGWPPLLTESDGALALLRREAKASLSGDEFLVP